MIYKNFWLPLVLSVLFVFSQTAGLLHAEIHPFHEHTEECDVYEQLAQPTSSAPQVVTEAVTLWCASLITASAVIEPELTTSRFFWGRAPPSA
ncbi:MAG: hypothetical protein U9N57_07865 [Pseudomonadota bacterium]|nr:hypothetical protein [Pseudomonadota bacterium]